MWNKPSSRLKRLWYTVWAIWAAIGIITLAAFMYWVNLMVFGICLGVWIIIMIGLALWIPAAYRVAEYSIGKNGVKMKWGVLWKKEVNVPYAKITNVDITRGPLERALNIGTIHLQTAGAGGQQGQKAELKLPGIEHLNSVQKTVIAKIGPLAAAPVKQEDQGKILKDILEQTKAIAALLKK
ncbi:MAG: PH domain-containing protein [Actinomycetota bacterium]|nr:PH domain-containing protein [Actinomycetota bacterium]